jgi:hypothetical protein
MDNSNKISNPMSADNLGEAIKESEERKSGKMMFAVSRI